jgi:uncharacterized protein (DUF1697 family)
MTVISLLRGVNLGPHRRMKMDALRKVYESVGLRDPQTFLQSGNVVFKTDERDLAQLAKRIEKAIEKSFGFRSDVIVRTSDEMKDVIRRNPFAKRKGIEPSKFLVWFLAADPGEESRDKVRSIKAEPEELVASGRELYIYFVNGLARPKLSFAAIDKALNTPGTGRNWNSVTKLLELAEKLERS